MSVYDDDVHHLTMLLSAERLRALTNLTGDYRVAIELHQETLRLGADLMNLTASIEIALRNTVSENLSQHFGVADWLVKPPPSFRWRDRESDNILKAQDSARRAEYAKLSQAEKRALDDIAFPNGRPVGLEHSARVKERRKHIEISDGKIIAELTFYFWKRIYGPDYEHSLWRPTLKKTSPDKKVRRAEVARHLETLYQTRNRLAHHEPVLHQRFEAMMASARFVSERLGMSIPTPDSPLARLIANDVAETEARAAALHGNLQSFRAGTRHG